MLKYLLLVCVCLGCLTAQGQTTANSSGKEKITPGGLRYLFREDKPGDILAKEGEVISFYFRMFAISNGKDTLVQSTAQMGDQPMQLQVAPPGFQGSYEEGLTLLSEGDSIALIFKSDSLYTQSPRPPFIDPGSDLRLEIRVLKIQSQEEAQKAAMEKQQQETEKYQKQIEAQKPVDDALIQQYLAGHKITNYKKTQSGLYYVIHKPGAGKQPGPGHLVATHYTIKRLSDDKHVDSNIGNEPFEFVTGREQAFTGFEEGVLLLKEGGKVTVYVPSGLAYGPYGPPEIGPNAILICEIELQKVSPAKE